MTSSYQPASANSAALLPADTAYFKFPTSLKWLTLGLAIALVGLMVFVLALQLTDLKHASPTVIVLCVAMFGSGTIGCLQIFSHARDMIAVNSGGIWRLRPSGESIFIAWNDVGGVSAHDTVQRLVVSDITASKKIRLEYQLENFDKLRAFVLDRTSASRLHTPYAAVFHRNWINRGFMLLSFAILSLFAVLATRQGQPGAALGLLGFGLLSFAGLTQEVASVEILNDAITIRYLGWQRKVAFEDITSIVLVDLHDRGNVVATVIIERRAGKRLRLMGFREGSVALNDALGSAWRASYGGQPPPSQSTAQPEPAATSQPLLTTFHGDPRNLLFPASAILISMASVFLYWYLGRGGRQQVRSTATVAILSLGAGIFPVCVIPRRLTIGADSFVVEFWVRRLVVPYSTVRNISLMEFRTSKGAPRQAVLVERGGRTTLRLTGFKEGALAMHAALREAWRRDRGGPTENSLI